MSSIGIWCSAILSSVFMYLGMLKTFVVSSILKEYGCIHMTNVIKASVFYMLSGYFLVKCTECSAAVFDCIMVGLMCISWYIGSIYKCKDKRANEGE